MGLEITEMKSGYRALLPGDHRGIHKDSPVRIVSKRNRQDFRRSLCRKSNACLENGRGLLSRDCQHIRSQVWRWALISEYQPLIRPCSNFFSVLRIPLTNALIDRQNERYLDDHRSEFSHRLDTAISPPSRQPVL